MDESKVGAPVEIPVHDGPVGQKDEEPAGQEPARQGVEVTVDKGRAFNPALLAVPAGATAAALAALVLLRRRRGTAAAFERKRPAPGAVAVNWGLAIFGVNCFGRMPGGMRFRGPRMVRGLARMRGLR